MDSTQHLKFALSRTCGEKPSFLVMGHRAYQMPYAASISVS